MMKFITITRSDSNNLNNKIFQIKIPTNMKQKDLDIILRAINEEIMKSTGEAEKYIKYFYGDEEA